MASSKEGLKYFFTMVEQVTRSHSKRGPQAGGSNPCALLQGGGEGRGGNRGQGGPEGGRGGINMRLDPHIFRCNACRVRGSRGYKIAAATHSEKAYYEDQR